jgi:outer membrane protein assembly factor BamB
MNPRPVGGTPKNNTCFCKDMLRIPSLPFAILFTLTFTAPQACSQIVLSGDEWPQWRGPDRSGRWFNGPQLDTLTAGRLELAWEAKVGSGYSGPTIAGGRLYLMDYMDGSERVLCFDASTGKRIWEHAYPVSYSVGYPTGPRASVLIRDGKAFSWGTMGHLYCLDAVTGEVRWKVNAQEQYQSRIPTWGMASNPILVGDHLIVQAGGIQGACLVAFHKETGKEQWRALDDEVSYSAPVLLTQSGREVVVCWTGGSITGLDPLSGSVYWSIPFQPRQMIMNVADPVYDPPYLFLSAFFDGSILIRLAQDTTTAEGVYHRFGKNERNTDALHCCISTPLLRDGYVYGIDSYGETRCLDLLTGNRIWEDLSLVPPGRWANVHLVSQADKVWGFNETGELLLGKLTPEGYRDLGRVKVIDPVAVSPNPRNGITWAHPAFAGTRIYFRSDSRLVCFEVKTRE